MEAKTAYVTGANGFIGSHLVDSLLERGWHVTGLVRPSSYLTSLEPAFRRYPRHLRLVVGDLTRPDTLGPGLEDADVVFHLGAVVMGTSRREFRRSIVQGTQNLVNRILELRGANPPRMLHVSSLAAAGPCAEDGEPVDESRPRSPVSHYGRAKADTEAWLEGLQGKIPLTVVRPPTVYGEREQILSGGTFPAVHAGLAPQIGFRARSLSVVYVKDLVDGMVEAATSPAAAGRTFFLCEERSYKAKEMIQTIASAMKRKAWLPLCAPILLLWPIALVLEWISLFTRIRPGLTRDKLREAGELGWVCTAAAAKQALGWTAKTPLADGMSAAVADWERRREVDPLRQVPLRDRVVQTYLIALLFGVVLESLMSLADCYVFLRPWVLPVVLVGVFMGVMGTLCLLVAQRSVLVQFLTGAVIGVAAELANVHLLAMWEFRPFPFGWIPNPTLRAIAAGLPAGLMPVIVTAIVRSLARKRARLG